jgi:hypothetical protein
VRLGAFAAAAAVIAIAASVIAADTSHDHRARRATHGALPGPAARAPTARPLPARLKPRVSSDRATRIARRFAASWRAWDTGRRTLRDATALRRVSVPALWRRLRRQRALPTASRPPAPLALHAVRAIATGLGTWRAALIAAQPDNSYLGTVVIVTTAAGPRVSELLP